MKRLLLSALLVTTTLAGAAFAADYTVMMSKGPAGTMTVSVAADGSRHVTYAYNDRGRGPVNAADIAVDAHGLTTRETITGVDYFKTPVDERLTVTERMASWSSAADEGSDPDGAGKEYVSYAGASEDIAMLARALLKSPNHELDLLPAGHARIDEVEVDATDLELSEGDGTGPRILPQPFKSPVRLYLISGLSFQPVPIWLDSDGELVNEGGSWIHTVLKGHEGLAPGLIKLQDKALADRLGADAKRLQRKPAALAITHARLFDSVTRKVIPGSTVVVRAGKIEAVGADGKVAIPAGAEVVDAHGQFLMPGLVDMHVHIAQDPDGLLDILAGVTTVRDLGDRMDELLPRRQRFDSGEQIGPRIWLAGLIDGKGPFAGPIDTLVSTPEEARADVDLYADHGYQQIKIYSSVKPELVPGMIARAHERGLRVSGHIPAGMTMSQAVDEGYDEVQHANFWFLNFMGPEVNAKSNTMARFVEVGAHAKDLDLNSEPVNAFVAKLKAHHTVVDPTLVAFEEMYLGGPRKPSPALAPVLKRLPPVVARNTMGSGLGKAPEERAAYAQSFDQMLRMTRKLHDNGIVIVAGTDGLAGLPLAHELENYVKAGIPSDEVLQIATLTAARVMHHDAEQGSIAPGKYADLILVDGDPIHDMSDIRKVRFVMKGGVIYDLHGIARSIGMKAE